MTVSASTRKEILELPRAVRATFEKGRPEYDQLIRRTRWGEPPIYLLGAGAGLPVAEYAAMAFETLLDWPAIARTPADFTAYAAATLRPRTIAFLISDGHENPDMLEAARVVRARNGIALALVLEPHDPLAGCAEGVFIVRPVEGRRSDISLSVCQQAAAGYIALRAAQTLKRPRPDFDALADEFHRLPEHIEWSLSQLVEGVRSLAAELSEAKSLALLGGGPYHPTALLAATTLKKLAGIRAIAITPTECSPVEGAVFRRDESLLVLTGSRCRVKKRVYAWVEAARRAGARILSLTDASDAEVTRRSALALLLPPLHELTGAVLAHAALAWTACHVGRQELSAR